MAASVPSFLPDHLLIELGKLTQSFATLDQCVNLMIENTTQADRLTGHETFDPGCASR